MKKYLESQSQFQKLVASTNSSVLEQINQALIPQSLIDIQREQVKNYLGPLSQFQKLAASTNFSVLEQINKTVIPQSLLQEQMERYLAPQRRLQELIFPPNSSILKQINNAIRAQSLLQEQMALIDDVHINEDGTFSVDDVLISEDCISECIDSISFDYESHIDFVSYFIEWLKNLDNPLRAVIANLTATNINTFVTIIGIVVSIAALPSCENEHKEFPIRMTKKEIIRAANEVYSIEKLKGYLFVSIGVLRVRDFGSNNADIVDELYIGKVVKLIEKSKSWSLVEYSDSDTGELKQGWVFSRYLSRFNK
jgi:hypothetical protein